MAVRLGELALRQKRITPMQLQEALNHQKAKGAKLGFEMSMDMQQMMNMGGMEVPTELGLNQTWVETCKDVDAAGVATLHTQFVRVHGNFSNPMMGEFPFDSDKTAVTLVKAPAEAGFPSAVRK